MTAQEYRLRFIARMMQEGVSEADATTECEAHMESNPDLCEHRLDPEYDAEECMSEWRD